MIVKAFKGVNCIPVLCVNYNLFSEGYYLDEWKLLKIASLL